MTSKTKTGPCALCGRDTLLTFHHLIPRKVHRRKRFQNAYRKDELARGVMVCRLCHSGLHRLYNEMTLATELNTLDKLLADSAVGKHAAWVRKRR